MKSTRQFEDPTQQAAEKHELAGRQPPALSPRFMSRAEVLAIAGVTYPALWQWMRDGKFPRARELGGKGRIGWLSTEVDEWISTRPVRRLKGDAE